MKIGFDQKKGQKVAESVLIEMFFPKNRESKKI